MKLLSGNRHNYNSRNIATGIGVHMTTMFISFCSTDPDEGGNDPFGGTDRFGEW